MLLHLQTTNTFIEDKPLTARLTAHFWIDSPYRHSHLMLVFCLISQHYTLLMQHQHHVSCEVQPRPAVIATPLQYKSSKNSFVVGSYQMTVKNTSVGLYSILMSSEVKNMLERSYIFDRFKVTMRLCLRLILRCILWL